MDLRLDTTGDLVFEENDFQLTNDGLDEIAQRLKIRLRFFFKEWILDRSQGTKWFELVLIKNIDKDLADQEVRQRILNTEGISSIRSWESTVDAKTRRYDATFTVQTTLGTTAEFTFSDVIGE